MELQNTNDLFILSVGDVVSKRNLYDLIQYSKVAKSQYWAGMELKINNTPQQGINWIGEPHSCKGVIIKTRLGLYKEDGWSDAQKLTYHYSFKAREGAISYKEKAIQVLLNQPQRLYPIMLFSETKDSWKFEGVFSVSGIEDNYVVLSRRIPTPAEFDFTQEGDEHQEGGKKFVTHLMAERNRAAVIRVKKLFPWKCDICSLDFSAQYEVEYIEAHHKIPISTFSSNHVVKPSDFALLCPNCHKAVHIYMKKEGLEYEKIKSKFCK